MGYLGNSCQGTVLKFQFKAISSLETLFPLVLMQAIACCWVMSGLTKGGTLNMLIAVTLIFPYFYRDPGLNSLNGVEECTALKTPFSKKGILSGCGVAEHLCHIVEQL